MSASRQSFASQSTGTLAASPRHSTSSTSTFVAPSRPSTATTTTTSNHGDSKRPSRPKHSQFNVKYGHKHHSYDTEKAPYPVSYDRHVLELESLDSHFIKYLKDSVTMIPELKQDPPYRTLDLGCGSGDWVINAAKEWPKTEFVGFDLVNVQIPTWALQDSETSNRITWTHGNFLTNRLPFEDEEFDHVHIKGISRGVPESKWDALFVEVKRVLAQGGAIEILEDDILFPILPRWFTDPLRARAKRSASVHYPLGTQRSPPMPNSTTPEEDLPHDHVLLESLYHSVFEKRFINLKPSAILLSPFTTHFRHVQSAPVTNFSMPSVPPPQPLPQPMSPSSSGVDLISSTFFGGPSPPATRPTSMSFSSTMSAGPDPLSASFTSESTMASIFSVNDHFPPESLSSTESQSRDSSLNLRKRALSMPHTAPPPPRELKLPPKRVILSSSTSESTSIGQTQALVPTARIEDMSERSLAMHLYRSYMNVMAVQEPMWDELKERVQNDQEILKELEWEKGMDVNEENLRPKFEKLLELYQSDMQTRISFWCSLTELGWILPPKEPLSKAEHVDEERMHEAIKEAMESASEDDLQTPCRSTRVIIGYKA